MGTRSIRTACRKAVSGGWSSESLVRYRTSRRSPRAAESETSSASNESTADSAGDMASERKKVNGKGTSTRHGRSHVRSHSLVCIDNRGYEASLERNKIYLAIRDESAEQTGDVRIVDESGEDYLYSRKRFVPIEERDGESLDPQIRSRIALAKASIPRTDDQPLAPPTTI